VPFVSKALGVQLAKAASRVMVGDTIAQLRGEGILAAEGDGTIQPIDAPVAVKEAVLPFKRFRTREGNIVDAVLSPEMRSTGEVMGIDVDFPRAFAKSQISAYGGLPDGGKVFVSVNDRDKRSIVAPVSRLVELGYALYATEGTARVLARHGIDSELVGKFTADADSTVDATHANIVDMIHAGDIDMVINTPSGGSSRGDGYEIRTAAVSADLPIFTTMSELQAAVASFQALRDGYDVTSLQEYNERRKARA
jgi:carbamoyl-phosphate synthase large subunit